MSTVGWIKICEYDHEYKQEVLQLNDNERYRVVPTVKSAAKAPALYISAVIVGYLLWIPCGLPLLVAALLGAFSAVCLVVLLNHLLTVSPFLSSYGEVVEIHDYPRGVLYLAMDTRRTKPFVVGIVGLRPISSSEAEVVRWVVTGSHRGMGIGRALLDKVTQYAVDLSYDTIEVDVADLASDVPVSPMYERRGFRLHHTYFSPHWALPLFRGWILVKDLARK